MAYSWAQAAFWGSVNSSFKPSASALWMELALQGPPGVGATSCPGALPTCPVWPPSSGWLVTGPPLSFLRPRSRCHSRPQHGLRLGRPLPFCLFASAWLTFTYLLHFILLKNLADAPPLWGLLLWALATQAGWGLCPLGTFVSSLGALPGAAHCHPLCLGPLQPGASSSGSTPLDNVLGTQLQQPLRVSLQTPEPALPRW